MRHPEQKLGACRGSGEEEEKTGANSSRSAGRMVRQKSVARKVQLVNKFAAVMKK